MHAWRRAAGTSVELLTHRSPSFVCGATRHQNRVDHDGGGISEEAMLSSRVALSAGVGAGTSRSSKIRPVMHRTLMFRTCGTRDGATLDAPELPTESVDILEGRDWHVVIRHGDLDA